MSVVFDPEGTITISGFDGHPPVVLGRPTLGQYRERRDAFHTAHKRMKDSIPKAETAKKKTQAEAEAALAELELLLETWLIEWLTQTGATLSTGLPDDPESWPADFVLDQTLPGRMLDHWRRVPLAPGPTPTT